MRGKSAGLLGGAPRLRRPNPETWIKDVGPSVQIFASRRGHGALPLRLAAAELREPRWQHAPPASPNKFICTALGCPSHRRLGPKLGTQQLLFSLKTNHASTCGCVGELLTSFSTDVYTFGQTQELQLDSNTEIFTPG